MIDQKTTTVASRMSLLETPEDSWQHWPAASTDRWACRNSAVVLKLKESQDPVTQWPVSKSCYWWVSLKRLEIWCPLSSLILGTTSKPPIFSIIPEIISFVLSSQIRPGSFTYQPHFRITSLEYQGLPYACLISELSYIWLLSCKHYIIPNHTKRFASYTEYFYLCFKITCSTIWKREI